MAVKIICLYLYQQNETKTIKFIIMKTTVKEFEKQTEVINGLSSLMEEAKYNVDYDIHYKASEAFNAIHELYFNKLEMVNVSYMVGSRLYYEAVYKIGKTYFTTTKRKMTKSRGFRCIEEIEEITEQMHKDMIADSYYY